ncbi:SIR2 family protein [Clostridium tagluense]|uniref:AAA+ ATPase domain-containing protein n=1 Tax=Clostridium tagluense TaxID=360422 RepID=A0A401UQ54_9CLOT|nr:SIR2 family protein [Clostridium tagluense]GCD11650.1 hypothetical protein Ctaglu_32730 [Clostridium tagluense]
MTCELPSTIKKAIKNNTLVFFIGSGTSVPLGFPNWDGLVIEILNELAVDDSDLTDFIPLLKKKRMTAIEILEKVKSNKKQILEIMKKRFLVDIEDEKLIRHKKLWEITSKIITTNYDTAIENSHLNKNFKPTVYTQSFEIAQLNKNVEYLLKLHGSIEDVDNCILFNENYKDLYDGKEEKCVLFQLKKILTDCTIVFLGFSLQDPYVCNIFETMNMVFEGLMDKHFIISTTEEDFSRYGTEVLKIKNWEDGLEEILDEMIQLKPPKDTSAEEVTATIEEENLDVVSKETYKIKIALLLASPIDNPYKFNLNDITKNFDKLDVDIDCYHLSLEKVSELEGYDYIILFCETFKNKLCLEDEYFKSDFVSLKDLEDNLYCENLKAVFCFTNDNIEIEETLTTPIIIYKQKKSNIKDVIIKLFRRFDEKFITSECKYNVLEKIEHIKLTAGKANIMKLETTMPDSIDIKNLTEFVGRKSDLEAIIRKVMDIHFTGQILTIKGSGGIGKTTIVKKIVQEFSRRSFFSQGIYFIDLEHIENYNQFEHKIAQCFGVDNIINFKEHVKLNKLEKDCLIVLDNFETLLYVEDSPNIKELVKFISDYAIIILTTREIVFPDSRFEEVYHLRDFTTEEAVKLFQNYYKSTINENEMKILKSDIIENLLNKNPLAIKIVATNLPNGKDMKTLKRNLEEDFFNTLGEYKDDIYINECDQNIERSKSLYQSINYSYKRLQSKEKLAFELLSLFPDGINMEYFKKFFKTCSKKSLLTPINDCDLKSLGNKSLVDLINGKIKLQSIIRRFSEYQFNQSVEDDKVLFFKEAYNYNYFLLSIIRNIAYDNYRLSCELFDNEFNNFIKSITYINKFENFKITKIEKLKHINALTAYKSMTYSTEKLLNELAQLNDYFDSIQDGKLLFNLIKIKTDYNLGNFDTAFRNLKKIISFTEFRNVLDKDNLFRIIIANAFALYFWEGDAFEFCKWMIENKLKFLRYYNDAVFELGKYTKIIDHNNEKTFFDFDIAFNRGSLNEEELINYINNIYPNNHLEKMQIHYLKSKQEKLDRNHITNLVVTNPYTLGLQNLMYAFIEKDKEKAIEYYMRATENLKHIKYYYVECIYYFSSFLKEIEHTDYDYWLNKGYTLAKQHYYGFLIYRFECLLGKTTGAYNEDGYPLPEELNFDGHFKLLEKSI